MTGNQNINVPRNALCVVVGNRPQFIKIAPLEYKMDRAKIERVLVHTGQHYDESMSGVFFSELGLRTPDRRLEVSGKTHATMTAELLVKLEHLFQEISPRGVLIVGDTTSTLAAALAAVKLQLPIAHLEAGPRLGDLRTPEETNRIVADHLSKICFAPDQNSMDNLAREGLADRAFLSGDIMLDAFIQYRDVALERSSLLRHRRLQGERDWIFMTLHRPFNVDHRECHEHLIECIRRSSDLFVFPAHARTHNRIAAFGLSDTYAKLENLVLTEPLGYVDSIAAIQRSRLVITDSGGVQKEAYFAGKKSLLLLDRTPWPSLRDSGWQLTADALDRIDLSERIAALDALPTPASAPPFFGDGHAADHILDQLKAQNFL